MVAAANDSEQSPKPDPDMDSSLIRPNTFQRKDNVKSEEEGNGFSLENPQTLFLHQEEQEDRRRRQAEEKEVKLALSKSQNRILEKVEIQEFVGTNRLALGSSSTENGADSETVVTVDELDSPEFKEDTLAGYTTGKEDDTFVFSYSRRRDGLNADPISKSKSKKSQLAKVQEQVHLKAVTLSSWNMRQRGYFNAGSLPQEEQANNPPPSPPKEEESWDDWIDIDDLLNPADKEQEHTAPPPSPPREEETWDDWIDVDYLLNLLDQREEAVQVEPSDGEGSASGAQTA